MNMNMNVDRYVPVVAGECVPLSVSSVKTGVGGSNLLRRETVDISTGSEPTRSLARTSGNASALGASCGNSPNVDPFVAVNLSATLNTLSHSEIHHNVITHKFPIISKRNRVRFLKHCKKV